MNAYRIDVLRERISAVLQPISLEIEDESHQHAGHAGAESGRGHFRVKIVSELFTGLRPLQRHRLVYDGRERNGVPLACSPANLPPPPVRHVV